MREFDEEFCAAISSQILKTAAENEARPAEVTVGVIEAAVMVLVSYSTCVAKTQTPEAGLEVLVKTIEEFTTRAHKMFAAGLDRLRAEEEVKEEEKGHD